MTLDALLMSGPVRYITSEPQSFLFKTTAVTPNVVVSKKQINKDVNGFQKDSDREMTLDSCPGTWESGSLLQVCQE